MASGSCLYGKVGFSVEEPLPDLYQYHCSLCRTVTGSSNSTALVVPARQLRWLRGEELIRSFVRETGYRNDFCTVCGSTVPNLMRTGDGMWIPAGSFDGPIPSRVGRHLFVASKAEWDEFDDEADATAQR
ncbi:MAG: GFA family protein [Methylobacterium frigidaeris]